MGPACPFLKNKKDASSLAALVPGHIVLGQQSGGLLTEAVAAGPVGPKPAKAGFAAQPAEHMTRRAVG